MRDRTQGGFWLRRRIAGWILLFVCAGLSPSFAADEFVPRPRPQRETLEIPPGLPRYDLQARLDLTNHKVYAHERIDFTNRTSKPVTELVLHVYPRFRAEGRDRQVLAKTLEALRVSPAEALDPDGRRLNVDRVAIAGKPAPFDYDPNDPTILVIPLPQPLAPGKTVSTTIAFTLDLPPFWGRWGHHNGVTYLLNWYPVLAFHDDRGWERTPFVPWHQPWHQEAGRYRVRVNLPADQVIASSGRVTQRETVEPGRQEVTILADPARDFAFVCSSKFETLERQVGSTRIRVHTFPENRVNAKIMLDAVCEVFPVYEEWFGPYPDEEFEVCTSYFGWNGNECSGLVLIDDRVMRLSSAGRQYLEHLVSHETCHQWWWNVVGTDGYAETVMDEGLVTCFTALRLDRKHGRNAPMIVWPKGLNWLPTIGREDLRLTGYYGWRARGNNGPVVQDLSSMGNLNALFSLAYDRGGKVIDMIHNRLGDERFFAFFRMIYRKYAFKTLSYADFRAELIAFDPTGHWDRFLDGWLVEHADTDWAVESVRVGTTQATNRRPVTVTLRQKGAMLEPTVVLCDCAEGELRVPIWPDRGDYQVPGASVQHVAAENRWVIQIDAPSRPSQVMVDPDHALLDAVPDNNRWRPDIAWRVTPFMTPLDESSQFHAYDRPSVVAGPFVDQYARGGFRLGMQRVNRWQANIWAGTEPALREAIFGGQATLYNLPAPHWSTGIFYEQGLYNFYNDKRHSGGRAFLRYRFLESSSFIVDDQGFAELYFGTGNEFWQGDDGRPVDGWLDAIGVRYRLSTLFPYWDPVEGSLIETTAEYGDQAFGSYATYFRMTGEYGIVRPFPEWFNRPSRSRLAFRAYGGFGYPDVYPLFRLGGGRRLRALDLSQNLGSSVWLMTFEWRYPLWCDIDQDAIDHVVGFRNLFGTVFYDVGQSFYRGVWGPVVHGIGTGLRIDVTLFSFLERASLRVDLAQPVGLGPKRGPVLWFGINQVF